VCKFFIEAIESQKFGWFWECPNGNNCQYRHALPPGFVLKSQRKALDEAAKANTISLEEFLEVERHKLGTSLTPVTPETFAIWKKTRMDKKEAEQEALKKAKDVQNAAGKNSGMSGRDLVSFSSLKGSRIVADCEGTSSNIILNGSRTKMKLMTMKIGTLQYTGSRKRRKIWWRKSFASRICLYRKVRRIIRRDGRVYRINKLRICCFLAFIRRIISPQICRSPPYIIRCRSYI
jgi:hypothetical protein